MIPIIGLTSDIADDEEVSMFSTYAHAIVGSGGLPLVLPYVTDGATLDRFVDACDGFVFTGGADIDPARYGEEKKPSCKPTMPLRDALEFDVFERVYAKDKPILAICRGAQLANAALGGTLYQDIPTEYETSLLHVQRESKMEPSHRIRIERGTPLFALLGQKSIVGNSFHHQAVKRLADGLKVTATAEDGIIEGFYDPRRRYFRAYQWHPERLCGFDDDNKRLFDDFMMHCGKGDEK